MRTRVLAVVPRRTSAAAVVLLLSACQALLPRGGTTTPFGWGTYDEASAALPPDELDPGVRDCMRAGKHCVRYWVNVRQVRKSRTGNFWLDTLNFRRETHTVGWSFTALIVFVEETVVLVFVGGQPNITEIEVVRNPLGPLQSLGEALRPTF